MHPSDKLATAPAKIAILNYKEVTRDPRVWKQALSLAAAGHDVTVYCNQQPDMPLTERLNDVRIMRFRCYDKRVANPAILEKLHFLELSGETVRRRYENFIQSRHLSRRLKREFVRILNQAVSLFSRQAEKASITAQKSTTTPRNVPRQDRDAWHSLNAVRSVLLAENLFKSYKSEDFDIVHAHDIYTLPAGILLARACDAKLVYDAHEYEPERVILDDDDRKFTLKFEDDCLTEVDALITVSSGISKLYGKRFPNLEVTLILNTPAMEEFDQQSNTPRLRERLGLSADIPLVVCIGGIQRENRGLDKLVRALTLLPDYNLVNLGPRHQRNEAWLRGIAKEAGVSERLHYLDPVLPQEVPHVVSDASVAAIALQNASLSYFYSMPNKLFESAFAEVPLCVPDFPDQKEFVETLGIGRTMDQTDVSEIAKALKDTVENPGKFKMTDDKRERLIKEYGWTAQVERLIDLYDLLSESALKQQKRPETSS